MRAWVTFGLGSRLPRRREASGRVLPLALLLLSACAAQAGDHPVPEIRLPSGSKADGFDESAVVDAAECPGGEARTVDGAPAAWTVIHYAAADNNLEEHILEDINEMELGHGGSPNVNVLVQLDRKSEAGVWRWEIRPDRDRENIASELVGYSEEEPDSGDWRTLASFGRWAATCYPAENYLVIVAGHGYGFKRLGRGEAGELPNRSRQVRARDKGEALRILAPDDSQQSEMYVSDLVRSLSVIRRATERPGDPAWVNRLVAYGSDACLMQTLEVGYELRNAVTYLLGSEETEPGQGWPYSTVMRSLTDRPYFYARRPYLLAEHVVEHYGASYSPWGGADRTDHHTLAAVDTGVVIRARNRVDRIATLLLGLLEADPSLSDLVWRARHTSFTFGDGYTDLGKLLARIREEMIAAGRMPEYRAHWDGDERARELRGTIDELLSDIWPELVVASGVGDAYEGARGVSIYFPVDQCGFSLDVGRYQRSDFASDTAWGDFVGVMLDDFSEGGGVVAAYGTGTLDVTLDGAPLSGLRAECELDEDKLFVFNFDGACVPTDSGCLIPPQVNMNLTVTGLDLRAHSAYVYSEEPRFDAEARELSVEIVDQVVEPGHRYAGSLRIPFVRRDTGETMRMLVNFDCNALEARACQ